MSQAAQRFPDNLSASGDELPDGGMWTSARRQEIDAALSTISSGSGTLVWIAEPGMGKSALMDRVAGKLNPLRSAQQIVPIRVQAPAAGLGAAAAGEGLRSFLAQAQHLTGVAVGPQLQEAFVDAAGLPGVETLASLVGSYLADAVPEGVAAIICDDVDRLDELSSSVFVSVVAGRRSDVVLLATATDRALIDRLPYPVNCREIQPLDVIEVLSLLRMDRGVPVAPRVARELQRVFAGNPGMILQAAKDLNPRQLASRSVLPYPLPMVDYSRQLYSKQLAALTDEQRFALLTAACSVSNKIDVLLDAAGVTVDDLLDSALAQLITAESGTFVIADERVLALVHESAGVAERAKSHAALAAAHAVRENHSLEQWHRALSSLVSEESFADELIELAKRLRRHGSSQWAMDAAREAATHTTGEKQALAYFITGQAALESGYTQDAIDYLRQADRQAGRVLQAEIFGWLIHTNVLATGSTPDELPTRAASFLEGIDPSAPDDDEQRIIKAVTRALLIAACQRGLQGIPIETHSYLEAADRVSRTYKVDEPPSFQVLRSWAAIFDSDQQRFDWPVLVKDLSHDYDGYGRTIKAFDLAQNEEYEQALTILDTALDELAPIRNRDRWSETTVGVVSPLVEAHLRLGLVFVHMWAGNIGRAIEELNSAAMRVPIGVPIAGIATNVARRLDMIQRGEIGPVASALEETSAAPNSPSARLGLLIDRAVGAVVTGHYTEAATLLELANERERAARVRMLPIPGVDLVETWVLAGREEEARAALESLRERARQYPVIRRGAALLRAELCLANAEEIPDLLSETSVASRALFSPFERGRTELTIGRVLVRHGNTSRARDHYIRAIELFASAEAGTFLQLAQNEFDRIKASDSDDQHISSAPSVASGRDLREAWSETLTDRELDVALLVVEGASNREVAEKLFLSVRTVEVHLGRIFRKLGVRTRVELAVLAHRN